MQSFPIARPASLAGCGLSFAAVCALAPVAPSQVPPGWAVVSSFHSRTMGAGGLCLVHPAVPGAPIPITGVSSQLTGPAPGGFVMGAASVLVEPTTGNLVVGEHAPPGRTTDIHVLTLNGTAVAGSSVYTIGTAPTAIGSIDQMAWLGDDIVFSVRGGNFTSGPFAGQLVGILRPSVGPPGTPGTVVPVPITMNPTGVMNALTVDEQNGLAYFSEFMGGGANQSIVYSLPVPGTGVPVAPTVVVSVPATVLNLAMRNDGTILFAGTDPMGAYFAAIDPRVTPATVTPLPAGMLAAPNGIAVETATGEVLVADPSTNTFERLAGGVGLTMAMNLTGVPSGVAIHPSLLTYGAGTPGANSYEWDVAPNLGRLPTVGNTNFSITVSSSPGTAPGVLGFSFGSGNLPLPGLGVTLLLDPGTLIIQGFLPAQSPVTVPLPIPATPSFAGLQLFAQSGHIEANGVATTNGLRISIF